jgi:hypothetical protein
MELKFFFRNFVNKSWIGETVTDREKRERERERERESER